MTDFLTADLTPVGGSFRPSADDFEVEEIPLYPASGSGEHLFVTFEKTNLTTFDLIRQVARALQLQEREIGYAGLKDAHARTRQRLSLPRVAPGRVQELSLPGVRVLSADFHRNKLRPGHLAGNRFVVRVRGVAPDALERARRILAVLAEAGLPNLFGPQRYGALGTTAAIGRALLKQDPAAAIELLIGDPERINDRAWREGAQRFRRGDLSGALAVLPRRMTNERRVLTDLLRGREPAAAMGGLPRPLLRLFLSAAQSEWFDRLVRERLPRLDCLEPGDLAIKHANQACFLVTDAAAEQPRAERFEISPSGPLFGYKSLLAEGEPGRMERELLADAGLELDHFRLGRGLDMPGERRALRVPLDEPEAIQEQDLLTLRFALPPGSYATSVLRELLKTDELTPANDKEIPDVPA